jgi:hypothetical protein
MKPPPLRVHRMIERMMADLSLRAAYRAEPEKVMEQFEVEPEFRPALRAGETEALRLMGVHPSMLFKLLLATDRCPVNMGKIAFYLDRA